MGWLKRLFGLEKPQNAQAASAEQPATTNYAGTQETDSSTNYADPTTSSGSESIAPERMGLNGEYDQSGLAKRVALAFDEDPNLDDIDTLYVAQTGSTVVFKGKAPSQDILNQMVAVALEVEGATNVESDQVTIG